MAGPQLLVLMTSGLMLSHHCPKLTHVVPKPSVVGKLQERPQHMNTQRLCPSTCLHPRSTSSSSIRLLTHALMVTASSLGAARALRSTKATSAKKCD